MAFVDDFEVRGEEGCAELVMECVLHGVLVVGRRLKFLFSECQVECRTLSGVT
jgi:hypothetical protein